MGSLRFLVKRNISMVACEEVAIRTSNKKHYAGSTR